MNNSKKRYFFFLTIFLIFSFSTTVYAEIPKYELAVSKQMAQNQKAGKEITGTFLGNSVLNDYCIMSVLNIIMYDHFSLETTYLSGAGKTKFEYKALPLTSVSQAKTLQTADMTAKKLLKRKKSDKAKVRAIYDWLIANVSYDEAAASATNEEANINGGSFVYAYNMEGPFLKGKAVCQGYTKAFQYLCLKAGIPSIVISSEKMNHSWNAVYLDHNWYQLDATYDDLGMSTTYDYFLIKGNSFQDHEFDDGKNGTLKYEDHISFGNWYYGYENVK